MKNLQKAAAVTAVAGGLAMACAGVAAAASTAHGTALDSPGVAAGNLVQAPVHVPVNVTGDTVSVIGALNPAFGDHSANR